MISLVVTWNLQMSQSNLEGWWRVVVAWLLLTRNWSITISYLSFFNFFCCNKTVYWQVQAEDSDEGGNGEVTYIIQTPANSTRETASELVTVHKTRGILTVISRLPPGRLTVFVEASDTPSNPSETRTSLAIVTIEWVSCRQLHCCLHVELQTIVIARMLTRIKCEELKTSGDRPRNN